MWQLNMVFELLRYIFVLNHDGKINSNYDLFQGAVCNGIKNLQFYEQSKLSKVLT